MCLFLMTDKSNPDLPPLLESKLELQAPEVVFVPNLDQESADGFYALMEG